MLCEHCIHHYLTSTREVDRLFSEGWKKNNVLPDEDCIECQLSERERYDVRRDSEYDDSEYEDDIKETMEDGDKGRSGNGESAHVRGARKMRNATQEEGFESDASMENDYSFKLKIICDRRYWYIDMYFAHCNSSANANNMGGLWNIQAAQIVCG